MRIQEPAGRDVAQEHRPAPPSRTAPAPGPAGAGRTPADILALQRTAGNAAVSRLLDQERHAHGSGCGHETPVQRRVSPVDVVNRPGRPLETSVQDKLQYYTGKRYEDVRIHTDSAAHESAAGINADAYTSGQHIAFQRGRYNPSTPSGMEMLIHEVRHRDQQMAGSVPGTDMGDGTKMSSPGDSGETDATQFARDALSNPAGNRTAE
ncbi:MULTISPECIES: DUF4157 domain-containing protein [Streptomyces]|uniref:DUF4157 domain-containing protein n=1 Tax=Streptomyces lycii TaxID=2654337 RepID=A0ABQ7FDS5_9ACTN|nr:MULTISPECIES: DUF4157 domain-containing protein [Streptomyces]KAF4406138.1 DUF4157 domain-containing protein [Streptomyces lycii]PGH49113.1 hypothetical protein CRI70_19505 [Streptomyces sp. Ru87]